MACCWINSETTVRLKDPRQGVLVLWSAVVFVTRCDQEVLRCPCIRITPAMMCCGCCSTSGLLRRCSRAWRLCAPGSL